jgi:hypothetical protein
MSSPIALQAFDERKYREFLRTLSDEELIKAGKRLRVLCGDVVTTTPCVFDQELKICREEYRGGIQNDSYLSTPPQCRVKTP